MTDCDMSGAWQIAPHKLGAAAPLNTGRSSSTYLTDSIGTENTISVHGLRHVRRADATRHRLESALIMRADRSACISAEAGVLDQDRATVSSVRRFF